MQFLQHRYSNTNTQIINRLELSPLFDELGSAGELEDHPDFLNIPGESLEAVTEQLLDQTVAAQEQGTLPTFERPALPSVMPALPTMYKEDGSINDQATEVLMRSLLGQGIEGFVVMGTTGESALVTPKEHKGAIQHALMVAGDIYRDSGQRISIVAGTGANWTHEQRELSREAISMGANATLLLPPYYVKEQSDANMIRHFWTALDEGPGIIYRVSGRTNIDISDQVIARLSQHPNFVGVKECEGRVGNLTQMFDVDQEGHLVWSGEDGEVARDRNEGAFGSISVTANVHPELVLSANEVETTRDNIDRAAEYLAKTMFTFGNPSTVHSVAEMVRQANGWDEIRGFRSPARALIMPQRQWTLDRLHQVGITNIQNFDDSQVRNYQFMPE